MALTFAAWLLPTRGREVWRLVRAETWRLALLIATAILIGELWMVQCRVEG
jgi:hypothetical protein